MIHVPALRQKLSSQEMQRAPMTPLHIFFKEGLDLSLKLADSETNWSAPLKFMPSSISLSVQ